MNREVLSMILVSNGDMYANDALQSICSVIHNYNANDFNELLDRCRRDNTLYESVEYKIMAKNLYNTTKLFNSIVHLGKTVALDFIKNNWELGMTSLYKES